MSLMGVEGQVSSEKAPQDFARSWRCVFGVTDCPQVTSLQALILAVNLKELPNLAEETAAFLAR